MRSFTCRGLAAGVVVAAAAFSAVPAGAANLLTNGGFEAAPRADIGFRVTSAAPNGEVQDYFGNRVTNEQYLTGWTIESPNVSDLIRTPYNYVYGPPNAAEGSQFFSLNWSPLGGITLYNTISQAFTLGAGATGVSFSAFMAVESGWDQSTLQATITTLDGTIVAQSQAFTHTAGNRTWSTKSWTTDLDPGQYIFKLSGVGSGNAWDVLVDDVQLNAVSGPSAAPEPSTWALLIAGFGMAGAALRRRERQRLA